MPRPAKKKNPYSVHPGVKMVQNWIATLQEKTGRDLDEWMTLIRTEGPADEKACRIWLKEIMGVGTNTAWWLAERARSNDTGLAEEDPKVYLANAVKHVDAMYSGPKEALRPIYDKLLDLCLSFAADVKACPCKTIVPIYRNHVIAEIKPTTRTRVDFSYALGDMEAKGRLIDTGGFAKKDRLTHRIPITTLKEIDKEVEKWLRVAYERDGD